MAKRWLYQKNGRFYGDFRAFKDVGGGQEALKPEGDRVATKDLRVARTLARIEELRRLREAGLSGEHDLRFLGPFVDYHLACEAKRKGATEQEIGQLEHRLDAAIEYFGEDTLLRSINTKWLQEYVLSLSERVRWQGRENPGTEPIKAGTQKKYMSTLSKLFRRARAIHVLPSHHRPFSDLMELPEAEDVDTEWLDAPTAALLLEAARLYRSKRSDLALPCPYTIVATLLLTGMRPAEGLGLLIEDLDFGRKAVKVRQNRYRGLKTRGSRRIVPLWPQLERILKDYLHRRGNPTEGLLFPSPKSPGRPVKNIKRLVAELSLRIGYDGTLTPKVFRHTYCAARLQTITGGRPVPRLQVAHELGHQKTDMVDRVYSHFRSGLLPVRRKPHVDFLLEDYGGEIEERLAKLYAVTEERTGFAPALANRVPAATELAVLEQAARSPREGPRKAAEALEASGYEISASGVRWIWKRYELHRTEYRLEAIETGRLDEVTEAVRALRST
jgi:integrase